MDGTSVIDLAGDQRDELMVRALTLIHRFGKDLFWIRSLARRLERPGLGGTWAKKDVGAICQLIEEMAASISDLLDASSGRPITPQSGVPLAEVVESAQRSAARNHPEIEISCCPRLFDVESTVDRRLEGALVDILDNAARASGGIGLVRISALAPPDVGLQVQDWGAGMSKVTLASCRTHGFTTWPDGEGHGIGLTVAAQTVEATGGQLEIDSVLGVGTRLRVVLAR